MPNTVRLNTKVETADRRKSKSATRSFAHLRPSLRCLSGAFPLLPRAFRVPSACLPPSARSRVALPLALRVTPCTLSRPPSSRRPPPLPARAPCSSRACSCCYCVFLRSCTSPRAFAPSCCAALSHAPNLAARAPRSPCRPRAGLVTSHCCASGVAVLLAHACVLRCCCRAVALWLRSPCSLKIFAARSHRRVPAHSPHRPSFVPWHSRSLPLRDHGLPVLWQPRRLPRHPLGWPLQMHLAPWDERGRARKGPAHARPAQAALQHRRERAGARGRHPLRAHQRHCRWAALRARGKV